LTVNNESLEVAGDPNDFIPVYNSLNTKSATYKKIQEIISELKNDHSVGLRIKVNQIPRYYIRRHDINALFKIDLPEAWRLIYGIITIHEERKAILLELFDHGSYEKRFGYK